MARGQRFFVLQFLTINADELPETMGVSSWGCSFSISVVLICAEFWPLVNKMPSSTSMDESITLLKMDHSTYSGQLG